MSELEAGRELDGLIEQRVFGATWRPVPEGGLVGSNAVEWLQRSEGGRIYAERTASGVVTHCVIEPYSTDIAAAWEVVEKLAACHPVLARQTNPDEWRVVMDPYVDEIAPRIQVYAPTAALAICRAAVRALGPSGRDE